jgi:hypothetical protein
LQWINSRSRAHEARPAGWDPMKRRFVLAGIIALGLMALLFLAVLTVPITLTPSVRHRLTAALNERFDANVDLRELKVTVLPHVRVEGQGLTLHHKKSASDLPPLIAIKSFYAEASLMGLIGSPLRLKRVYLDGLAINIPPGGMKIGGKRDGGAGESGAGANDTRKAGSEKPAVTATEAPTERSSAAPASAKPAPLIVDEIFSERATLVILRRDPEKKPRTFEIHQLTMKSVGDNVPWAFQAQLTNPTPPGQIDTKGTFGPWMAGEPSQTPLAGEYTFRNADLGVFKGIGGILTSEGKFGGVLERITVDGRATVPEFMLKIGGRPVPLDTRFHSIVDGTNGNTWLKPVDATLGASPIYTEGGVVEETGQDGRTVALDVVMTKARIEDVLKLALKPDTQIPFTGQLNLKTKFRLPPGERDVIERLGLDGTFEIATARFASLDVQGKINELSRRARGNLDEPARRVASNFKGRYVLKNGVLRFQSVSFSVPGASVRLAGTYTMRGEALDFAGTVHLDAKLSEMTTGFKSVLLKAVDPLVRRQGDTVIPVTIGGTAKDPKFKLDVKRTLLRR